MSATELDLPVLASAEQIRRRQFVTIRRGYDPEQVREFLERVADQVRQMEALIRDARLEAEAAIRTRSEPRIDPYQQLSTRLADVIRTADEAAERIRRESRQDAERLLSEARADADRVRADAQTRADEDRNASEQALREAKELADRTIAGLGARRETLVAQLATMQQRLLGVAQEIGSALDLGTEVDAEPQIAQPAAATREHGPSGSQDASSVPVDPDQDLWDGTETFHLDLPDISMLDLTWDDDEDG